MPGNAPQSYCSYSDTSQWEYLTSFPLLFNLELDVILTVKGVIMAKHLRFSYVWDDLQVNKSNSGI